MSTSKNSEKEQAFFAAVKRGDTTNVAQMINQHQELVRAVDDSEFGAPPLNLAASRNDLDMIRTLVGLGADVNQKSDWAPGPWSPALLALECSHTTAAESLISLGAEVDVHLAAGLSRMDRLVEILDADPGQIHARGGDGCTPLHVAGSPEVVDLLLDRGADIEARDVDHWSTPLQWTAAGNPSAALRLLERGAEPDIFSVALCGARGVVESLIAGDPEVVHLRINQETFPPGPDPDVHTMLAFSVGMNGTPLHAAATGNQPEIIKLLLDRGLNVDVTGAYDDCTALHLTAWNNQVEAAKALLDAGANKEQESGKMHQNTPLGWAIVAGSVEVVKLLLEHGCEMLDHYVKDAQHGINGDFKEYKASPKEHYEQIAELLQGSSMRVEG